MASPPFNHDATVPGDSDVVSQYPAAERTFRDIIESWLLIEHGRSGHHVIPSGSTATRDLTSDWEQGSIFFNTDDNEIQYQTEASAPFAWVGTSPTPAAGPIPSGKKMLFVESSAPSGWTGLDSVSDRMLRVVTASSGSGASTGGAWAISGLSVSVSVGATTLTNTTIPSHNHSYNDKHRDTTTTRSSSGSTSVNQGESDDGRTTGSTGSGGSHSHSGSGSASGDGNWRPSYQNVIVCSKT